MKPFCDIHTHVLPGIDDGAKNWDICLGMLQQSWDSGVRKVIATPHYVPWETEIPPGQIRKLAEEAERKAKKELGINIKIYPGQEIYFHMDVVEKLKKKEVMTLADSRYVLVEFHTGITYKELRQNISFLRMAGFRPVIAHVERYKCLRNQDKMDEMSDIAPLLQMNIHSLQGKRWNKTFRWCKTQLSEQTVDFLASDMHNLTTRPPVSKEDIQWIFNNMNEKYMDELLSDHAQRFIE